MKAELLDHMGDDLTVVNAARVSLDKHKTTFNDSDARLIQYLARGMTQKKYDRLINELAKTRDQDTVLKLVQQLNKPTHWTPFSHVMFRFYIQAPIFVARQWFRHEIGFTRNELSRRYVDKGLTFWTPDRFRLRPGGSIKQGSGDTHPESDDLVTQFVAKTHVQSHNDYEVLIERDVAPEQARAILPQATNTAWIETASLYAYARLLHQRLDPHAQLEIQQLARQVADQIRLIAPVSYAALIGEL